jgi:hypothetical protein
MDSRRPCAHLERILVSERRRTRTTGGLPAKSSQTLARLMSERGLSPSEIERGLSYAESAGARTTRQAWILAMSRVMFSDAELSAGVRFESD